jgi:hypothetical protein
MKKTRYRQCELVKKTSEGEFRQVSYIPEKYAIKGKALKLLCEGVWHNGWIVISAGDLVDEPFDWKQVIRVHRDNTGDSLPKTPKNLDTAGESVL